MALNFITYNGTMGKLRKEFESETGAHAFADQQYISWLEKMVERQRNCSIPDVGRTLKSKNMNMDIIKAINSCAFKGDTVIRAKVFENGFAVLKRVPGGTLVCCWEIDGEYHEECHENPIAIYNCI